MVVYEVQREMRIELPLILEQMLYHSGKVLDHNFLRPCATNGRTADHIEVTTMATLLERCRGVAIHCRCVGL